MNGINLVPNQYNRAYHRKWFVSLGMLGAVIVIIVLIFLAFIPMRQIKLEEERQVELDKKLKSEELEEVRKISQEIEDVNVEKINIEKTLNKLDVSSHITRKTMDSIVGGAPKGLRMNEVTIQSTDNTIDIKGKAKHVKNVAEYIIYLYNTQKVEQITYSTNQEAGSEAEGLIEYSIQIQLKPLVEEVENKEASEVQDEPEESKEETGGEESL